MPPRGPGRRRIGGTKVTPSARIDADNAAGAEELKDFPILIALDAAHFSYADSTADGRDLRFVDATGKLLNHEIESWTASGTSIVWLKLPELVAKAKTSISMYWGNPQAEQLPATAAQAEAPSGAGTFPNDLWNYFTVVIDIAGKTITNYKNGTPVVLRAARHLDGHRIQRLASNRASIGAEAEEDHGPHSFIGMLDEIRVETVARSPGWIAAQARAQKADWLSIGVAEARR